MNAEGKPYAGNPHVRFGEGPLARASCTAGWGLLNRFTPWTVEVLIGALNDRASCSVI